MPTTTEVERLGALAKRLIPLSQVQRGELIRADNWNEVVAALIEVLRTVLGAADGDGVPPHEHPEQVSLGWLDPRLRTLVQQGTLADPDKFTKLIELDRRFGLIASRVEEVAGGINEVRARVGEVTARDLARQADITSVRRLVEGLSDARNDVLALRESLQSIQADVKGAVDAAARFTLDGQPVDMAALDQRLRGVEELRDRLRLPSGALLDAPGLENRLAQLTNSLVTQQQFDEALRNRPGVIPPGEFANMENRLKASLAGSVDSSVGAAKTELRGEITDRLAGLDALVSRAVGDAAGSLNASLLGTLRPEIAAAGAKAVQDSRAALEQRLTEVDAALRQEVERQAATTKETLSTALRSELDRQLSDQLEPIRRDIGSLAEKIGPLEDRLTVQADLLTRLSTDLEVTNRNTDVAIGNLRQSLVAEMDRRDRVRTDDLNTRFLAADNRLTERLEAAVPELRRTLLEAATAAAADAAVAEVRNAETRLRADLRNVARDEFTPLRDELRVAVGDEVNRAMAGVPGIVNNEVRRATANLPQLVRTEFDAQQPVLRQAISDDVALRVRQPGPG